MTAAVAASASDWCVQHLPTADRVGDRAWRRFRRSVVAWDRHDWRQDARLALWRLACAGLADRRLDDGAHPSRGYVFRCVQHALWDQTIAPLLASATIGGGPRLSRLDTLGRTTAWSPAIEARHGSVEPFAAIEAAIDIARLLRDADATERAVITVSLADGCVTSGLVRGQPPRSPAAHAARQRWMNRWKARCRAHRHARARCAGPRGRVA